MGISKINKSVAALAVGAATVAPALAVGVPAHATGSGPEQTYVVLYHQGASSHGAAAAVDAAGGAVVANYDQIGVVIARSSDSGFAAAMRGAASVDGVASTSGLGAKLEDDTLTAIDGPAATTGSVDSSEPLFGLQWDMRQIKADQAHATTLGSPDVVVGVLDSGIDATHPDLADNVRSDLSVGCNSGAPDSSYASWQPTASPHGTHVAGTIAAEKNGIGVVGVAPNVGLAAIKVVDDAGYIYPQAAICGFMWAGEHASDIKVTNNSYYIDPWLYNCKNDAGQRIVWKAVQRAVKFSQQQGVLDIAAEGNENTDLSKRSVDASSPDDGTPVTREVSNDCVDLPVEVPGVVGVTAVGAQQRKAFYSSYGIGTADVTAPGGDATSLQPPAPPATSGLIPSTIPGGGWAYMAGTSMATPHAVGVAALIASTHPGAGPQQIANLLDQGADPLACPEGDFAPVYGGVAWTANCYGGTPNNSFYGRGEVDALTAIGG